MASSYTVTVATMTPADFQSLDEQGYTILEGAMSPEFLNRLKSRVEELFQLEGDQAGSEFRQEEGSRRLANLVDKGEVFEQAIAHPAVLPYVARVLGPKFKLSSLNVRSANADSPTGQPLHVDMAAIPDEGGYWVCNTIWMLDDFTIENGATRVIPGSHRWGKIPQKELADPYASHPDEVLITGRAGTVVVMNAHAWHGGTANRSGAPRTAMHGFYCRWDKPQQQYQKKLLRPEVQQRLSPTLRELLALDDKLNDRLSAQVEVVSGFLKGTS
jgi:ectoine hydroxylase-related dioxygenase (phytanoyl-CoA dioxygenase family)